MTTEVIWMRARAGRKGPRPAHSLDDIAREAVALADAQGLAAVSIRAVAAELGAGAASLYRYIASKDDLYDLMVDEVAAEYDLPDEPSGDWIADLTLVAERGRAAYRRHPWAGQLSAGASWGPRVQDYMEFLLAALEPTGLDIPERVDFIALLNNWIANFAQHEIQPVDGDAAAAKARHVESIAADPSRPHLAGAMASLLRTDPADAHPDLLFRRGLDRLFHGIAPR
ncbi:TetR/AcrR family transcriptional regulator [Streptomyces sp. MP131-18]|uniref:TetR/AcrR family transcriptional regulator n=1 Tax=Streptomyces sp. MP131-18 TaxID=1857892 RepID=UPI0009A24420|nr:TetR/AcrR family transcriptional regulator [Streptomyces sp. MP131-18]